MGIPPVAEAERLITWAQERNPGQWINHAYTAARAARTIAAACGMDTDRAYVLGLLHDIGRYEGKSFLRHVIAGHDLMMAKGYGKAALICLTHSFPMPQLSVYSGKNDCTPEDTKRIQTLLDEAVYDDEVRLIQLCDAISLSDRVTVMEQRLLEVAMRHGVSPQSPDKWRSFLAIKEHFDRKCGRSVNGLFRDEIVAGLM